MTHTPQACNEVDHYEAALQASCATLMTLQAIHARLAGTPGEIAVVDAHVREAIAALQVAIRELRLSHSERYGLWTLQAVVRGDASDGAA
jgi:hypothetical protein